jgi:hypothetical protein
MNKSISNHYNIRQADAILFEGDTTACTLLLPYAFQLMRMARLNNIPVMHKQVTADDMIRVEYRDGLGRVWIKAGPQVSHGVLVWPVSDDAPLGWGSPFSVVPGTPGGSYPNILIDYSRTIGHVGDYTGLSRGVNVEAGNCYWDNGAGTVLTWMGPDSYNIAPEVLVDKTAYINTGVNRDHLQKMYDLGYDGLNTKLDDYTAFSFYKISPHIYKDGSLYLSCPSGVFGVGIIEGIVVAVCLQTPKSDVVYYWSDGAWVTAGYINYTVPSGYRVLPRSGVYMFSEDGTKAGAIITALNETYVSPNPPHTETFITRLALTVDESGAVSFIASFSTPDRASYDLTVTGTNVTEYNGPYKLSYVTGTKSNSYVDNGGVSVLGISYLNNTEIVLTAEYSIVTGSASYSQSQEYIEVEWPEYNNLVVSGSADVTIKTVLKANDTVIDEIGSHEITDSQSSTRTQHSDTPGEETYSYDYSGNYTEDKYSSVILFADIRNSQFVMLDRGHYYHDSATVTGSYDNAVGNVTGNRDKDKKKWYYRSVSVSDDVLEKLVITDETTSGPYVRDVSWDDDFLFGASYLSNYVATNTVYEPQHLSYPLDYWGDPTDDYTINTNVSAVATEHGLTAYVYVEAPYYPDGPYSEGGSGDLTFDVRLYNLMPYSYTPETLLGVTGNDIGLAGTQNSLVPAGKHIAII